MFDKGVNRYEKSIVDFVGGGLVVCLGLFQRSHSSDQYFCHYIHYGSRFANGRSGVVSLLSAFDSL